MRRLVHILAKIRHVSGITVTMILGKPRIYVNGGSEIAQRQIENVVVTVVLVGPLVAKIYVWN